MPRGRWARGPRPHGDQHLPVPPVTEVLPTVLDKPGLPDDVYRGLVEPFSGPARVVLVGLLRGWSIGMAAASAGVGKTTLDRWRNDDPAFAQACVMALDLGFALGIEAEAYDRAQDRTDRASGRLLELILKARSPDYREKSQLQLEVVARVGSAGVAALAGWSPVADVTDSIEGS